MVVFHLLFDLNYLGITRFNFHGGFLLLFQRLIAFLFLGIAGVSLVLLKQKYSGISKKEFFHKLLQKSLFLFAAGLLITSATFVYPHDGAIIFGVIHFLALSLLIGFFFLDFYYLNLALGVLLLVSSLFISLPALNTPLLLWLGFPPQGFHSLDYYPLFPWFGIFLIGIFAGKALYEKRVFKPKMPKFTGLIQQIGRHSLAIYLLHQPVLIGLILLVKNFS